MTRVPYALHIPGSPTNVNRRAAEVEEALRRLGFRRVEGSVWMDHEEPDDDEDEGYALTKPGPY